VYSLYITNEYVTEGTHVYYQYKVCENKLTNGCIWQLLEHQSVVRWSFDFTVFFEETLVQEYMITVIYITILNIIFDKWLYMAIVLSGM
jgi:hypothetical protein